MRKPSSPHFFPVGDDIETALSEWVAFLKEEKLFGPDDPLFPATKMELDENGLFRKGGLSRKHWRASAIRNIYSPHFRGRQSSVFQSSFIPQNARFAGQKCCSSPEALKAWSQNVGHDEVLTTFTSYGAVARPRQAEILNDLARREVALPAVATAAQLKGLAKLTSSSRVASVQSSKPFAPATAPGRRVDRHRDDLLRARPAQPWSR